MSNITQIKEKPGLQFMYGVGFGAAIIMILHILAPEAVVGVASFIILSYLIAAGYHTFT